MKKDGDLKITIITVCYNEKSGIKKTIESVCCQTYSNIEYLIIDGASIDGTIDVLQNYSKYKNIKIYSEKDYGIYNAMNRGISKASGEYIFFLNVGDTFFDRNTVENFISYIKEDIKVIYFGKVCLVYADGLKQISSFSENEIEKQLYNGLMPCHQSIFAPRKLLTNHYFVEKYKIRADYEWIMYCVSCGIKLKSVPVVVCYYDVTGESGKIKNKMLFQQEQQAIINEYRYKYKQHELSQEAKIVNEQNKEMKYYFMFQLLNRWMHLKYEKNNIGVYLQEKGCKHIAIYGMGSMGLRLLEELSGYNVKVDYVVDRNANNLCLDLKVLSPEANLKEVDMMIVTAVTSFVEIKKNLKKQITSPVVSLEDIICEMEKIKV